MNSPTMSAFYSLKRIAGVTGLMSKQDLKKLIHAFISSRLVTVSFQASAATGTKTKALQTGN